VTEDAADPMKLESQPMKANNDGRAVGPGSTGPAPGTSTVAAALLTVTLWASAFVGIRSAGRTFSPGALTLGRLLVGCVVLGVLLVVRGERLPSWRQLRPVVPIVLVCGVLWFGGYNLLLNAGERRVDAGTAAMLVNVGPILVALLAAAVLHEGLPRNLLLGCGIAFSGVAVIAAATADGGQTTVAGVVLCLGAAAAYAGGVVAQKPILRTLSPLQTTFLCCSVGAITCLPFAPTLIHQAGAAEPGAIGWVVYLGAFPTAIAFTTWAFALSRTNAGRLAAVTYLVVPISILLGWLLLAEVPPVLAYLGGALCLAGVAVTRWQRPRSNHTAGRTRSARRRRSDPRGSAASLERVPKV
jgi:drug/metabolite transporter (DMT)-like permease